MSASLLLSWREGVTASADGEGTLVVQGPGARVSLQRLPVAILEALRRLDPPGLDQDRLCELIGGNGDGGAVQPGDLRLDAEDLRAVARRPAQDGIYRLSGIPLRVQYHANDVHLSRSSAAWSKATVADE